ncbi:MAG: AsmA-like C-terminal region-containing protein [Candidatus Binatus sp.]|uniref:DUF748 domain-containing protein n=1 Tax=Candidatus Binatus sp. TaxID=2811406 RepID=UPI00271D6A9B|nr:AsmA-like C-terminal region-containing protein [Candidatus Binatus sp.]MDO8431936.1 AsmA-like C-terminal region-containing protein [Candidatus Binatus sp.]
MRRIVIISAAVLGTIVIVAAGVLFYAATNLNSIIAGHKQGLLDRVSLALGREVQASDITVSLGWGITADLKNVKIGDDPTLAQMPFVEASDVYAKLQLAPLLARRIEVDEVSLEKPVIRIIQMQDGRLNVSTVGKKPEGGDAAREAAEKEKRLRAKPSPLGSLFVKNFSIRDGTLIYQQEGAKQSAMLNAIDLSVKDFGFNAPFTVALTMAAFADKQNLDIDSTLGPLMKNGVMDVSAIPFSVKAKVGPILLSQLRAIQLIAKSIPPKLVIPQPISAEAQADGTIESLKFVVSSDLSDEKITFGNTFNKPADIKLKVDAEGSRIGSAIDVKVANVSLGDLDLKATNIKVGGGSTSARIDTNNFDLTALAKMIPDLAKYDPRGKTEIHADVALADGKPAVNGNVTLAVGDLNLKATRIRVGGGQMSARIDTNSFDLAALPKEEPAIAKQVAVLAKYNLGGKAEIHSDVTMIGSKPSAKGTVSLTDVSAAQPDAKLPALSKLNGNIRLAGNSADVGPMTFNLGPAHGTLKSHVVQLQPLLANFDLTAGSIHLADFVPTRPPEDQVNQLAATGGVAMQPGGLSVNSKVTSASGDLSGVAYENLNLNASLDGKRARVQSLNVKAFSGNVAATAEAILDTASPFSATVNFSNVNLQQILAAQKSKMAETARGMMTGSAKIAATSGDRMMQTLRGDAKVSILDGNLADVPFQNLDMVAVANNGSARLQSLRLKAFAGDISATGETRLGPSAPFSAAMNFTNLDLQQMLAAQKSKSAGIVRGTLTGNMNVAAVAGPFDQMKPTFKGDGRLNVVNGKLIGVNIGGESLQKLTNLPVVGNLVPLGVIQRHPELFNNPNTDIQNASLSYVLAGPRITSHDIKVQTVDYNLLGDGWFDLDRNIDLAVRMVLSQPFSRELVQQNKNVAYIVNTQGQVDFPVQISGQLPKPSVLPNVSELAQRAAMHEAQNQGEKYLGKVLGKKGMPGGAAGGLIGGLLGGGSGDTSGGSTGGAPMGSAPMTGPYGSAPAPAAPSGGLFGKKGLPGAIGGLLGMPSDTSGTSNPGGAPGYAPGASPNSNPGYAGAPPAGSNASTPPSDPYGGYAGQPPPSGAGRKGGGGRNRQQQKPQNPPNPLDQLQKLF